jgi:hypothetical protein
MSFTKATARLTIGPVRTDQVPGWGGQDIAGDYNPKELQVDKTVPWSKHSYSNKNGDTAKSDRGNLHLEFTGAEGRSVSIELLFDGYEGNSLRPVAESVRQLELLTNVMHPNSDKEDERRPPLCLVAWGDKGLPTFKCVIESMSTKYTMFGSDGTPLRATVTLKLKEADTLSTKDAESPPDDAGGTGGQA